MPSKPSRADEDLAAQASAAGWPTTPDQVLTLRERKVIPPTTVTRRGRGVTMSVYPKGALDILVAVRREMGKPGRNRIERAAVFAWVNGADVQSEALRDGLVRLVDPRAFRRQAFGRRAHRSTDDNIAALITDPRDRRTALQTVAAILTGETPEPGPTRNTVSYFLDVVHRVLPASKTKSPVPRLDSADAARSITGRSLPGEAVLDLRSASIHATIHAVLPDRRKDVDKLRDRLRRQYAGRLNDDELLGLVIGRLHGLITVSQT